MVATVGSLIAALKGLDPALPVGALRVERRREMTDFALGDVAEVHVESDRSTGAPRAAWVVVGLPTVETPVELFDHVPVGVDGDAGVRVRVADPGGAPSTGDDVGGAVPALRAGPRRAGSRRAGTPRPGGGNVRSNAGVRRNFSGHGPACRLRFEE